MITKFLTIKFAKVQILLRISQEKQRFWTIFPKFSPSLTPLQNANFTNSVVSASLTVDVFSSGALGLLREFLVRAP